MRKKKVLIFIVAYMAEKTIEKTLMRIPESIWNNKNFSAEVLIIDDSSLDNSLNCAENYRKKYQRMNLVLLYNPTNLGYGGNQKIGYHYAIKNGFNLVVLLHGDGQYAPELLPQMLQPLLEDDADAVFGSRMTNKQDALKGGMPFYKYIGNQILTKIQNMMLNSSLSEFHSGYRAYNVECLKEIPFQYNSNDFDFDTDIIIQLIQGQHRIVEIPIPTYYGDELCYVNGMKYAFDILKNTAISKLQLYGLFYERKFDYPNRENYIAKIGYYSSHSFAIGMVNPGNSVLDIGCASGFIGKELQSVISKIDGIDLTINDAVSKMYDKTIEADLDNLDFQNTSLDHNGYDVILLLDVIEHISQPEKFIENLRNNFSNVPRVVITTANIVFITQRFMTLFGQFNYGKKGLLDYTHKRLFTFRTLKSLLKNAGYDSVWIKDDEFDFRQEGVLNLCLLHNLAYGHVAGCRERQMIKEPSLRSGEVYFSFFSFSPLSGPNSYTTDAVIASGSRKSGPGVLFFSDFFIRPIAGVFSDDLFEVDIHGYSLLL